MMTVKDKKMKGENMRTYERENNFTKLISFTILGGLLCIILLVAFFQSFYIVNAGERGVLLTLGKPDMDVKEEGFGFKIPFIQSVKKMEVRTQKYEASASSASQDLQIVSATIAVNYHLLPNTVPQIYTDVGMAYQDRIIQPAAQEVVKASTAQFTAEQLITKRAEAKEKIKVLLQERLTDRGIIIEDISITNFDFSKSFNDAIEAKVTAEQLKLKAERDLQRIEIEAKQKIEQAKAEAESIRIQSNALQENKDILQLRAIEKWNGVLPLVTGGATPLIDINNMGISK